jgi:Predicted 3'-5' exonuclease related to the exonuclease domain of PolB
MHDNDNLSSLENRLSAEMHSQNRTSEIKKRGPRELLVFDLEFRYKDELYSTYRAREHAAGAPKNLRWPYCEIVAASWILLSFKPGYAAPNVLECATLTAAEDDEVAITAAIFDVLDRYPSAQLVGYGSEQKDIPVLRRVAATQGILLPKQLRDLNPHSAMRIDLCNAVSTQAPCVHSPEYAIATGIPCKPHRSIDVGEFVMSEDWPRVANQVTADVFTSAVIAVRHLISRGEVAAERVASGLAIYAAMADANPECAFLHVNMKGWCQHIAA